MKAKGIAVNEVIFECGGLSFQWNKKNQQIGNDVSIKLYNKLMQKYNRYVFCIHKIYVEVDNF